MKPFTVDLEDLNERQKEREQADAREIFERIYQGSMPAIVSGINSNSQLFYSSYLSTYIERDVRELSDAIDSLKFRRFITAVAARCGQMVNAAEIARDADINQTQAKDWLTILETLGIIFYLHPYSNNLLKRLVKTPKLYFYDTGLVCYLTKWSSAETLECGAMNGAILENYVVAEIRKHEAERVTGELIAHHFVNKTQYKDYAILYRGNHQSRVFEKFLMQNRIPYKISGGTSFFSRPEIKDLLAYLRVLTNPDDDSAFLRIVNTPKREIGPATLKKLGEWAMTRNKSMFTASFDMGLSQTLSGRGYEALTRFTHWLAEIQRLAEREPIAAVRDLIHGMDYESWLYETSPSPKAAEMRMKNVNQLFSWMTEMLEGSELDEPMTLTQVVTRFTLRDMMERGESEEELDQVQLMTLHASKGLEFPYVYMVGMEEGFLPHQSSIDEDNIDEERRLAYVGITRAQKELTFTLCKERRQYGELVRPEPSRFLLELPQDDLIWEQERKVVSAEERMQKGQSHLANLKAMMAAKRGK